MCDAGDRDPVSFFTITQATTATFNDLYIGRTFLCFVRSGRKRVVCPVNGELLAEAGDLIVFPPEAFVTLENRPMPDADYQADGAYFAHDLIREAFSAAPRANGQGGIKILTSRLYDVGSIFNNLKGALDCEGLPAPIRRHRLLEPLLWLRHLGVEISPPQGNHPVSQVRRLLETDLCHPWRIAEVARHFGMSEATLRRWLAGAGHGFARVLRNARLERALALLQTTDLPVSTIALDCGFNTPSHFSDSFKKRFGVGPKSIRSARG